jgi:hypothetical protein
MATGTSRGTGEASGVCRDARTVVLASYLLDSHPR